MASDRTVVALFARSEDAHRAINKLIDSGVSPDRIGYLEPVDEQAMTNPGTTAGKGIAAGAASGAVIGGRRWAAAAGRLPGGVSGPVGGAPLPGGFGAGARGGGGGGSGGQLRGRGRG